MDYVTVRDSNSTNSTYWNWRDNDTDKDSGRGSDSTKSTDWDWWDNDTGRASDSAKSTDGDWWDNNTNKCTRKVQEVAVADGEELPDLEPAPKEEMRTEAQIPMSQQAPTWLTADHSIEEWDQYGTDHSQTVSKTRINKKQ